MTFSLQAERLIESFAANLGLAARPASDGSYSFVFEQSGTLTFTPSTDGERLFLSLSGKPDRIREDHLERLLSVAGPDISTERFLSAGLTSDNTAIFAVSLEETELNLPTLETCLQQLMEAQAQAG